MSDQVKITFPDGKSHNFDKGITGLTIAKFIAKSLAKEAIAFQNNGVLCDLNSTINNDSKISIIKREDNQALELIRHDCAHVMAESVQELFPGTQVTIGPSIENGFYYDFARDVPFTTEDLLVIEKKMHEIISKNHSFKREIWGKDQAINYFTKKGELYKVEIIQSLPNTEDITIYKQGNWLDLCRGPHMPSTKYIGKAFKLMKVAGAYWRGDSSNVMLTRIYGTAWRNEGELHTYLKQIEEFHRL